MSEIKQFVKQNDEKCLPEIQKIGCFFRSALHIVEQKTGAMFDVNQINNLWKLAKERGIIDSNNDLMNSAKLMNLALKTCFPEYKGYFAEIGIARAGLVKFYPWAEKAKLKPEYFIKKHLQSGPSVYHYVVVNDCLHKIFDPHEPEIIDRGEVYTICYRYFTE